MIGSALVLLFFALVIGANIFWLFMLIECATKEPAEGNDKLVWILIIVLTGWIGALIYYFVRRPQRIGRSVVKSHPWVGLSIMLLAICIGVATVIWEQIWDQQHTFLPTPETESAFLKNYTPKGVIERFQDQGQGSSYGRPSGGEAGRKFVTHTAGFNWYFAMRSEKWISLMNALRDDVSAKLVQNGAQILSQSGDARDGFHFEYKLGNSIGTLTISPLSSDSSSYHVTPTPPPLGQGLVYTIVRIEQTEKWFPKQSQQAAFKRPDLIP